MKLRLFLLPCILLALTACEETDEQIVVHPDGRIAVNLTLTGQTDDVIVGYPLPVEGPWRALNPQTKGWLAAVGADHERPADYRPEDDTRFEMAAVFASSDEMPRFFAPAGHPYQSAFLERNTKVDVRRMGERTVYVFERTFEARTAIAREFWDRVSDDFPESVLAKISDDNERGLTAAERKLTGQECQLVAAAIAQVHEGIGAQFARTAMLGVYTLGDASLSPHGFERIAAACGAASAAAIDLEQLAATFGGWQPDGANDQIGVLFDAIERAGREALRAELARALEQEGVAPKVRNAVLEQLEWHLTANDQTEDLGDDKFIVRVKLPGVVVGGNAEAFEDGFASWTIEGGELCAGRVTLTLVAVQD